MTRLKLWLLCLSVGLNLFFAGAYLAPRLPWHKVIEEGSAPAMPYETLGLSDQQRAVFEAERGSFHSQLTQTRQAIHSKQDVLVHLLSVEKPDRAAISALQQEILSLQGRLQNNVISHLLKVGARLSQAQRERFYVLLKEHMTSRGLLSPSIPD